MKRTFLLSILAAIAAALMPMGASGQILHRHKQPAPAAEGEPSYKWEAYAGLGYTSLNQVSQSRSGLLGANLSITRDFGKYFGLTAQGAACSYAYVSGNPGTPSVDTVLFGPVLHAPIIGKVSGLVYALLGGEHTGGESMTPNISFAGGGGGGLEYKLFGRFSARATGDVVAGSFTVAGTPAIPNPAAVGDSPHMTRNSRATIGVVYRF